MACACERPGSRVHEHVMAELEFRSCPRCGCRQSRPVDGSDVGDGELSALPLRVCAACDDVFGFDDSMTADADGPVDCQSDDDEQDDGVAAVGPRTASSPCFRDPLNAAWAGDWSPGEDVVEDRERRHHEQAEYCRGDGERGRGRGLNRGGHQHHHRGGRHHHHGHCHYHHHQQKQAAYHRGHHGHGRRGGGRGGGGDCGGGGAEAWKAVGNACLQTVQRAAPGVASGVVSGRLLDAAASVTGELDPLGRAMGSAIGGTAGSLVGAGRAGEVVGSELGASVVRGVGEIIRESPWLKQSPAARYDDDHQ